MPKDDYEAFSHNNIELLVEDQEPAVTTVNAYEEEKGELPDIQKSTVLPERHDENDFDFEAQKSSSLIAPKSKKTKKGKKKVFNVVQDELEADP